MNQTAMKICFSIFILTSFISSAVFAQRPEIAPDGILNVASYTPSALPGGGIAQGSIFAIFGSGLGPSTLRQIGSYPLPKTLDGTSVQITANGKSTAAPMIYTSSGQVAALLPSNTPLGEAALTLTRDGQTSAPVRFQVVANSFGAFSLNQAGNGPGVITDGNYNVFGIATAANPLQTAILWGTGLGAVNEGAEASRPLAGDMTNIAVEVYVGGERAMVTYRGRSGCCAGLDQIVFTVPAVSGCQVPVVLKIGDTVSNFTSLAVAPAGSRACQDAEGPAAADVVKDAAQTGVARGSITLLRSSAQISLPLIGTITTSSDSGTATFFRYAQAQMNVVQNPFQAVTAGACTVYTYRGTTAEKIDPVKPIALDAGAALTVKGPDGSKKMAKTGIFPGYGGYSGSFGATIGGMGTGFLGAGTYLITGPGGKDVGQFAASAVLPQPLVWTNRDSLGTIKRGSGQTIAWTGGDPAGTVQIAGSSVTAAGGSPVGAAFTCNVKASDGKFTIPSAVLLSLPASGEILSLPLGLLSVGSASTSQKFTASGLDSAGVVSVVDTLRNVKYQ